jgi:hypothetical protein
MSMFVVVRHPDDLVRAGRELSDFFSLRKRQAPRWVPEPLLGIWLDPRMTAREVPATLSVRQQSLDGRPARIRESFGLSGVWTLCWLDDEGVSRLALVEALLEASLDGSGGASSGRFIPVFRRDVAEPVVQVEVRGLRDRYPSTYWDRGINPDPARVGVG